MIRPGQVLKIVISLALLLSPTLFTTQQSVSAFSVSNGIKEYNLNPGEVDLGSVSFTNTEKKDLEIKVETKSYDPQKEEFVNTSPFVGVNKSRYTLKAGQSIDIEYAVSIPSQQPTGSFFNVLTIEPVYGSSDSQTVSVDVRNGFGVLFAFHITQPDTSIDKIFIDNSDTRLIVENKGLPYLMPMKVKYVYENKSDFVFKPQGEIRLVDKSGKQVAERFAINEDGRSIYPGEKLEVSKEIRAWNDVREVLDAKVVVARTYNGFTENYLTNMVDVSIKEPVIMTGVLILLIVAGIISGIISVIRKVKSTAKSEE